MFTFSAYNEYVPIANASFKSCSQQCCLRAGHHGPHRISRLWFGISALACFVEVHILTHLCCKPPQLLCPSVTPFAKCRGISDTWPPAVLSMWLPKVGWRSQCWAGGSAYSHVACSPKRWRFPSCNLSPGPAWGGNLACDQI